MREKHTVTLPDIGEGVVEGEVVEWLKKEGDPVKKDEPVVIVMTDKATVELPSLYAGIVSKHYYQPGETAYRGKPLYDVMTEEKGDSHALATPAVRKIAKELNVDIEQVLGTGFEGRVTEADVVRFHAGLQKKEKAAFPDDEEKPLVGLQHMMAKKMVESKSHIPHFSLFDSVDVTRLIKMKEKYSMQGKKEGITVTYMPFFIKALSMALQRHPEANSSYDFTHNKLSIHHHHHVGIATPLDDGLAVVVLKDVQLLSLEEVIRSYQNLMKKVKSRTLTREDMIGSTITISNFGPLGGRFATPIINSPEVAILGIAKIEKQPVVRDDEIVIRPLLNLSWSFDHRVLDGASGTSLSNTFIRLLENPAELCACNTRYNNMID